jgi:hypothetical protein
LAYFLQNKTSIKKTLSCMILSGGFAVVSKTFVSMLVRNQTTATLCRCATEFVCCAMSMVIVPSF